MNDSPDINNPFQWTSTDFQLLSAEFVLGRLGHKMYAIADAFVAAGDTTSGFFDVVILGENGSLPELSHAFEAALLRRISRLPMRSEAALLVARDYCRRMLSLADIDVRQIQNDLQDLMHEVEGPGTHHPLSFVYYAMEANDYDSRSKVYKQYKEQCRKLMIEFCK